jgi:hypothetical protein
MTAKPARDFVTNALPLEDQVQRDPDKSQPWLCRWATVSFFLGFFIIGNT